MRPALKLKDRWLPAKLSIVTVPVVMVVATLAAPALKAFTADPKVGTDLTAEARVPDGPGAGSMATADAAATLRPTPTPGTPKTGLERSTPATPSATSGMETKAVIADPDALIGRSVVSLDGIVVGEVAAVQLDSDGLLSGIEATIGGFFGFGAKTLMISADDFKVEADTVVVAMTEADVNRRTE